MLIDDVFVYGDDDDDDDNHGKSDNNTNNTYKFRVSVIVTTVMICHGDDEGDADGCRKCNGDSFGKGCCDSIDAHLTPHTSHLTPHTSHLTPHTSHLTPHT